MPRRSASGVPPDLHHLWRRLLSYDPYPAMSSVLEQHAVVANPEARTRQSTVREQARGAIRGAGHAYCEGVEHDTGRVRLAMRLLRNRSLRGVGPFHTPHR